MAQTVSLSLRVDAETAKRLDDLAEATDRSRSWLLENALDAYLETQAWQIARIEQGMAELKEGQSVPHEDVAAWLRTWGKNDETDPPQ